MNIFVDHTIYLKSTYLGIIFGIWNAAGLTKQFTAYSYHSLRFYSTNGKTIMAVTHNYEDTII